MAGRKIKCEKCDREFKEEEAHTHPGEIRFHKNKVICEDCLVGDFGTLPDDAAPYWDYAAYRTDLDSSKPL